MKYGMHEILICINIFIINILILQYLIANLLTRIEYLYNYKNNIIF